MEQLVSKLCFEILEQPDMSYIDDKENFEHLIYDLNEFKTEEILFDQQTVVDLITLAQYKQKGNSAP